MTIKIEVVFKVKGIYLIPISSNKSRSFINNLFLLSRKQGEKVGISMKKKISICIDEKKLDMIEELLKEEIFRNKSHIIEYSLNKFLEEKRKWKKN